MTGRWDSLGYTVQPNMAEYHLDWWNGFNEHNNDDTNPPTGGGLIVHLGGDYRVVQAYVSRGEGVVYSSQANDPTEYDTPWFSNPPSRSHFEYDVFYVRDIEWFTIAPDLTGIEVIKEVIRTQGVLATCMCWDGGFYSNTTRTHYQPPNDSNPPNHSIAIIGWDDQKRTQAPLPGAWLCKNSWGSGFAEAGYFWISYYDKHCCRDAEMGAVSFQNVQPLIYDKIYYHDYHGWRDTKTDCSEAMNAFIADANRMIIAVSFITAADDVTYTAKLFDRFEEGRLLGELNCVTGHIRRTGFHTVDLPAPTKITAGDDFYVYLKLSDGGQAIDRTSEIPVLLGDPAGPEFYAESAAEFWTSLKGASSGGETIVVSSSDPGQSFYLDGMVWSDLHEVDDSANFCIKALAVDDYVVGDFDNNGKADAADLATLAAAWLSRPGQDLWNPQCDLYKDDWIDLRDLAEFAQNW